MCIHSDWVMILQYSIIKVSIIIMKCLFFSQPLLLCPWVRDRRYMLADLSVSASNR